MSRSRDVSPKPIFTPQRKSELLGNRHQTIWYAIPDDDPYRAPSQKCSTFVKVNDFNFKDKGDEGLQEAIDGLADTPEKSENPNDVAFLAHTSEVRQSLHVSDILDDLDHFEEDGLSAFREKVLKVLTGDSEQASIEKFEDAIGIYMKRLFGLIDSKNSNAFRLLEPGAQVMILGCSFGSQS